MRSLLHRALIVLTSLLSLVSAASNFSFNPFLVPRSNEVLRPGSDFLILWDPTTTGPVSLFVRTFGLTTGIVIADGIEASTGQFLWAVPASLVNNVTDPTSPFIFEMRIYDGSLGKDTQDVDSFSDREYNWSIGYFAITANTSFTTLSSYVTSARHSKTGVMTMTASGNLNSGTLVATTITQTTMVTRIPTFAAIASEAERGGYLTYQAAFMVIACMIFGAVIL